MSAISSPPPAARSALARAERPAPLPTVIWGRNEDTRLLLRGLLRLYRYPIAYEAATLDELRALPPAEVPRLLLFDAEGEPNDWYADLAAALQEHTDLRAVVILPREAASPEGKARSAGARVSLARPFAIHDLVAALERASGDDSPPPVRRAGAP
jgi:hypothetical protein